jgi:hypothetical protein
MNRSVAVVALALTLTLPAAAQRRARLGPVVTSISVEDGTGTADSYLGFGGTIAFLTGDDGEAGIVIARYDDLSNNACVRQLTFFGFNSLYYPVGARGVAPFASTEIGLARVTEANAPLIFTCTGATPVETTSELGFAFGLGVRVGATDQVAALVEGRFVQIPNSFIQGLEVRGNVSVAFGKPRNTQLLSGTLGPAVSFLVPISGPLRARTPFLGVRFRRDTKKSGVLGLQIDYAPLKASGCSGTGCEPTAILFAPAYEASLYPVWGRFYGSIGGLLVGFPGEGPDRGMTQGAHGGVGADIFAGERLMVNVNARLLWIQRNTGENIFGVQVGGSLSPKLTRARGGY